jgi:hypothetical protein
LVRAGVVFSAQSFHLLWNGFCQFLTHATLRLIDNVYIKSHRATKSNGPSAAY